jgi:hypothetical protein
VEKSPARHRWRWIPHVCGEKSASDFAVIFFQPSCSHRSCLLTSGKGTSTRRDCTSCWTTPARRLTVDKPRASKSPLAASLTLVNVMFVGVAASYAPHWCSLSAVKILRLALSSAVIDFRPSAFSMGTHRFRNLHSIIECCLSPNLVKRTKTSRRSSGFPVPKSRFQPSTRALETAWRCLLDSASIQPFQRDFTCRRCGGAGCHRA